MTWPPYGDPVLTGTWQITADPQGRDAWVDITVPSAWQGVLGHGIDVTWWRTTLPDLDARRRHWLRFESVATDCTGWLDGVRLGRHVGDWVPFQWALPPGSRGGQLVLRVDMLRATPPDRDGDLQRGHITKGFHDVISIQHAGVWQPVSLAALGDVVARPDGVHVTTDPETGDVRVGWTLEAAPIRGGVARVDVRDPDGRTVFRTEQRLEAGEGSSRGVIPSPAPWSPDTPALYSASVALLDDDGVGETHELRFGFRTVEAVGRRIHLNGAPIQVRGVLDWGHEPEHIAPSPSRAEIRERFARLRALGFNTVCVCMWYPPRAYYELADETGMMVWQEHPVWQAPMREEDRAEYRRLYAGFLARDRHHPSVILVSATCEHPCFDAELADWWWRSARATLPHTLLQLQTAFFRWADPDRTDLHDEHTYESSDRWVPYLDDLAVHLNGLEPKPFVMGETVLFTSWPRLDERNADAWWAPRGLAQRLQQESKWTSRFGPDTVERLRRDGDRFHLLGRKFQVEMFRRDPDRAGLVMNHLRDVPQCQCGFMDDDGRWRFEPHECRPWLSDAVLILETPDQRRAFSAGERIAATIALSNFTTAAIDSAFEIDVAGAKQRIRLKADPGSVGRAACAVTMPPATLRPVAVPVAVRGLGLGNDWRLWSVPAPAWPAGAARADVAPLTREERAPSPAERAYSKGYGLDARSWSPCPPEVGRIEVLPRWPHECAEPDVLLTHRLTPSIRTWIERGGRAILLASGARDSIPTVSEWLFGQVPLIVEQGPLEPGDRSWVIELLGFDLVRRWCRQVPSDTLDQVDRVQPFVRCAYTHDQVGVRELDMLYEDRLGDGRLVVSSLDHGDAIGQWLLARCAEALLA